MSAILDTATRDALREIGCLREDGLDGKAFSKLLAEQLEANHVAGSLEDIGAVETTVGQLVNAIVGVTDPQLLDVVRPLLATGYDGRVQKALSDGKMLCARRAKLTIDIDGETKTTSVGTRFLSSDPDVLDEYVLKPREKRADSFIDGTKKLVELCEARQPEMAPRVETYLEKLSIKWQKQLNPGEAA